MARTQYPGKAQSLGGRMERFWQRVTEGMELNELWGQFRSDARTSYRLYSQEVDTTRSAGGPRVRQTRSMARQVFWLFMEKLTPVRRVLLLVALVLMFLPGSEWHWKAGHGDLGISTPDLRSMAAY